MNGVDAVVVFRAGYRPLDSFGILVVCPTLKQPPCLVLPHATPLLKKEGNILQQALISDGYHPLFGEGACVGPALATHYDPMNSRQINLTQMLQQWLDGKESNLRIRLPKVVNPAQAVSPVLDTYAPPNVWALGGKPQTCGHETTKSLRALCQNLISVPVCADHHPDDRLYVFIGHTGVEQVAHGVDEHKPGRAPTEWLRQLFGNQAQVKTLFIGMPRDPSKSFGKPLGIAVLAAGTYPRAAADRVPRCVSPLD